MTAPLPPFLAACRRLPAPHTPVWILRQAGRYLPEYRALRARHDFLALVRTPELAAEATLQPVRRFPLDAAILFSDLLTPFDGLGLGLRFAPGPVLERPLRDAAAVDALAVPEPDEAYRHVTEAIRILRRELPASVPLVGFAGAPWTLYCYLVEGRGGNGFPAALGFLAAEPAAAARLLATLTELPIGSLAAQARAGAQALMLFDSWAGLLAPGAYREVALPGVARILAGTAGAGVPRIYFPRSAPPAADATGLLRAAAELPAEVIAIDSRTSLAAARAILGPRFALQGNLAPAALHADDAELDRRIDAVLADAGAAPGHVFNLGDGIEPESDPAKVARLVERVHRRTARTAVPDGVGAGAAG